MTEYAALIRQLANDYYEGRLSTVDYRNQRRELIDRVERKYNGAAGEAQAASQRLPDDITQQR